MIPDSGRRQESAPEPVTRPPDVDTGFWLWLIALPLMTLAYCVDLVVAPRTPTVVYAVSAVFLVVLAVVVVTFLILMRHGYRWARTLLTGGGFATVVYMVTSLLTVQRPTAAAMVYAGAAIVGSVLILGGMYVLHRSDAHVYFIR